jgi:hypothetical protein
LRVFIVTGTSYGAAAATASARISASSPRFRQRAAASLAGHLGHGAAEVQVDVADAVLGAEDLGGLADVAGIGAVELDRPDGLEVVEDQHLHRGLVALDQPARGDHLADVQAGPLLGAEPSVRRVGDARHRREDDGSVDAQRPEGQRGGQGGHGSIVAVAAAGTESSGGGGFETGRQAALLNHRGRFAG